MICPRLLVPTPPATTDLLGGGGLRESLTSVIPCERPGSGMLAPFGKISRSTNPGRHVRFPNADKDGLVTEISGGRSNCAILSALHERGCAPRELLHCRVTFLQHSQSLDRPPFLFQHEAAAVRRICASQPSFIPGLRCHVAEPGLRR